MSTITPPYWSFLALSGFTSLSLLSALAAIDDRFAGMTDLTMINEEEKKWPLLINFFIKIKHFYRHVGCGRWAVNCRRAGAHAVGT